VDWSSVATAFSDLSGDAHRFRFASLRYVGTAGLGFTASRLLDGSPHEVVLLLHGPTQRRAHSEKEDIKNSDRNGPEGQFKATGSTMCNAGLSPWYPCFMIQVHPIKVSMKKKRKEEEEDFGSELKNL
jgi:hypothetical protein